MRCSLAAPCQRPRPAWRCPSVLWTPPTQIYVEIERARLTRQLARMREAEGKVQEAAEILQEVAVVSGAAGVPACTPACPLLASLPALQPRAAGGRGGGVRGLDLRSLVS